MNCGVRIVKCKRDDGLMSLPIGREEKRQRQSNREIISTVRSWIAEVEQRRRASEQACRRLQAGEESGV